MTNTPGSKPSPRIPIDSCAGMMEKLRWEISELEKGWTEYRTFNYVVTAYHLYADWIKNAGSPRQRQNKGRLPAPVQKLFAMLRDMTNASKHWSLNPENQKKQVVEGVSKPQIGDWHAYLVAGPVCYVSIGGTKISMPEIVSVTMQCFEWVLDDGAGDFPKDLETSIVRLLAPK